LHSLDPDRDCSLCPRLHGFIGQWRHKEPGWFNAPVPAMLPPHGPRGVRLLIVGLAPGLRGANRTGRPFTGDYAGELLYKTLAQHGFSSGSFDARPDDGLTLKGAAIVNAVRCVPPENKPTGAEINTCRQFLTPVISALPDLAVIVTLGRIAHESTARALESKPKDLPFSHGGRSQAGGLTVISSYHCSRYNTNTGRLTEAMFNDVFVAAKAVLNAQ
jgi:uracil-DNA glycosylase family 4